MVWSYCMCRNKCTFSQSTKGVSKTRGRGRSWGQGQGRGRGHFFTYFLMSFFLSFNPNSDFSQFLSAVYRYNIFICMYVYIYIYIYILKKEKNYTFITFIFNIYCALLHCIEHSNTEKSDHIIHIYIYIYIYYLSKQAGNPTM